MKSFTTVATTLLATAGSVDAFWRMPCRSRTGIARMDPLVDPGQIADHVHTIHGSGGFSMGATYDDLNKSSCTSCAVTQDKSAYWTPSMHFVYKNGTSVLVNQVGGMLAYYLLYLKDIQPFPEGFMMLAGNRNVRNFTGPFPDTELSSWPTDPSDQFFLEQRAVGVNCLDYSKAPEPSLYRHKFPTKDYIDANCKDGIRMELAFPSCGTGELDSKDHKSHMAFPSLVKEGNCPDSHPVHYPFLFYETIWATQAFAGEDGEFVFSHGDPVGTGYHGDFMMGWESEELLAAAIQQCTNPSGRIEDCPVFNIQSDDKAAQCTFDVPESLKNDNVKDHSNGLPVDVPIQYGPEVATKYPCAGREDSPAGYKPTLSVPNTFKQGPTLSYSAANPEETKNAQGGIIVAAKSALGGMLGANKQVQHATSAPPAPAPPAPAPTAAPAQQPAPAEPKDTVSYITKDGEVIEMHYKTVDVTVTATASNSPQQTAPTYQKRHLHHHQHNNAKH